MSASALPRRHSALLTTLLIICAALTSYSTLEAAADHAHDFAARHPVVTAIGTAVVVGGAVYALDHHRSDDHPAPRVPRSPCYPLVVTQCAQ